MKKDTVKFPEMSSFIIYKNIGQVNLVWQMVFLFLLKSVTKLLWLHWQHKLLLLGNENANPDCAFMDCKYKLALTLPKSNWSLSIALPPSEFDSFWTDYNCSLWRDKSILAYKTGFKEMSKWKEKLSNSTNKLNIQPMLSELPYGFQWKYAAFSQVVLWKTTPFSQVQGKFKHKETKTFLISKTNTSPCSPPFSLFQFPPAFV